MEQYKTTVCFRKENMKAGTYYVQTNPRASNIIFGESGDFWNTTKKQLHEEEAGNKNSESRRSSVRRNLKEREHSIERKKTNLGHSIEFRSADQCKHAPYDTDNKNFKEYAPTQVREARYTGIYMPGAADIRRMENVNRGRAKIGLPPLKKLSTQEKGL